MRTNQLKRKLAAGQVVVGSFVYVPSSKTDGNRWAEWF